MDYIRILQFEEWRKNNDRTESGINRINMKALNGSIAAEVSKITHNEGLINQRVIGGKTRAKITVIE